MSTQILQFCSPTEADTVVGYDYMTTSQGHNLDEKIPTSYPVSTQFAPIFSPSLEYRGPDSTHSLQKSSIRPLAPRKGSPRRETHIPRPRNPFMIFRSEYHAQSKITTDVERDHRHISRIVGYLWNNMSEEDKTPYRAMAEKEKAEHQRKYPGYRFCPGTRTSKPVKRKVKRNGQTDLARSQKVAELLKAGLHGRDLETAVKDIDFESLEGSSPSADDFSRSPSSSPSTQPSPTLPDVRGWQPSDRDPAPVGPVFRSPLLAPLVTLPAARPVARRMAGRPIMDSLRPDPPSMLPDSRYISPNDQPPPSSMALVHPSADHAQLFETGVAQDVYGCRYPNTPSPCNIYHNESQFTQYHPPHPPSYHSQIPTTDLYRTSAPLGFYPESFSSDAPVDMTFQYYESLPVSITPQGTLFPESSNGFGLLYEGPAPSHVPDPTNPLTWDPMQFIVNM